VPRLCELYPDICLTNKEKALKNLSQGSRRVPVGKMKTEYTERSIHNNNKLILKRQFLNLKEEILKLLNRTDVIFYINNSTFVLKYVFYVIRIYNNEGC
jgi:hypothetical protein